MSLSYSLFCPFSNMKHVNVNPFHANILFPYLLKTSEIQRFSDIFREYRNGTLTWKGLMPNIALYVTYTMRKPKIVPHKNRNLWYQQFAFYLIILVSSWYFNRIEFFKIIFMSKEKQVKLRFNFFKHFEWNHCLPKNDWIK